MSWYDTHRRDLPWRRTRDPYRIWVSEIMLQQTTVRTVLGYYDRFLARFPTVVELSRSEIPEVLKYWEGLGYYQRAKNLHRAAKIIAQDPVRLKWPLTVEEWSALPGIGRSTAGAIHSISTDQWAPILDANVRRVTERLSGLLPDHEKQEKRLWEASDAWGLRNNRPGDTNQALMELGAVVCLPAAPSCEVCPVSPYCRIGTKEMALPESSRKGSASSKGRPPVRRRVALVPETGRIHFSPRKEGRLLEGLLEISGGLFQNLLPGNNVPGGPLTGWRVVRELFSVRHVYSHFREEVRVLLVAPPVSREEVGLIGTDAGGVWATRSEADNLALTGVARKILAKLKEKRVH